MCLGMVGSEILFCEWFGEVYCDAVCAYLVSGEINVVDCFARWEIHLCLLG